MDFIVEATFLNPYSPATGSWDYGLMFRDEGTNNQYRLIVSSDRKWSLRNYIGSADGTLIDSGHIPDLRLDADGSNKLILYCKDNRGLFCVNGDFITELDLSARTKPGDIQAGTGFYTGNEINGYSTNYQSVRIWEIP